MLTTLLLCVPLQAADFEIDAETLAEVAREARTAVAAATGVDLSEGPEVLLSSASAIERVLNEENVQIFRNQVEDEQQADAQREQWAELLSDALLAKYAWGDDQILIAASTFESMADLLEMPGLHSRAALRAVLVHEFVHAVDERRHAFSEQFGRLVESDHILCLEAVTEGNAQRIARAICVEKGWEAGFEVFTNSIGALPADPDRSSVETYMMGLQMVRFTTAYYDGEHFATALHAAGGDKAIARAFREPPSSPEILFHPEWFLDPASRPALTYDLDAALASVDARFEEGWASTKLELSSAQMRQSLGLLPREDVERIVRSIKNSKAAVHVPENGDPNDMLVLGVMELGSFAQASDLFKAQERLIDAKDALFEDGPLELKERQAGHARLEETQVYWCRKVIGPRDASLDGGDIETLAVVLLRGSLVLELSIVGGALGRMGLDRDELMQFGRELLAGAIEREAESAEDDQ